MKNLSTHISKLLANGHSIKCTFTTFDDPFTFEPSQACQRETIIRDFLLE